MRPLQRFSYISSKSEKELKESAIGLLFTFLPFLSMFDSLNLFLIWNERKTPVVNKILGIGSTWSIWRDQEKDKEASQDPGSVSC